MQEQKKKEEINNFIVLRGSSIFNVKFSVWKLFIFCLFLLKGTGS